VIRDLQSAIRNPQSRPTDEKYPPIESQSAIRNPQQGWQVLDEPSPAAPEANGSCSIEEKIIRIRPDLDPLQKTKTLAHELSHVLLHSDSGSVPRSVKEVEAESVAFVVMACLGYAEQAGDYSFPYLAHWMANGRQADAKILTERIGKILDAADAILKALLPQASQNG
jgi:hypothetical protein